MLRKDRIGTYLAIGPWWCRLGLGWHPSCWYGAFHMFRKVIWMRPINYAAIDAAPVRTPD
jgi:hypothetical protein